jgi:hypothetical protein
MDDPTLHIWLEIETLKEQALASALCTILHTEERLAFTQRCHTLSWLESQAALADHLPLRPRKGVPI